MKKDYREVLGRRLKDHRDKIGITTYRVSKFGKIQPNQVAAIEEGSTNYTLQSLMGYLYANDLTLKIETKDGDVIFDSSDLI